MLQPLAQGWPTWRARKCFFALGWNVPLLLSQPMGPGTPLWRYAASPPPMMCQPSRCPRTIITPPQTYLQLLQPSLNGWHSEVTPLSWPPAFLPRPASFCQCPLKHMILSFLNTFCQCPLKHMVSPATDRPDCHCPGLSWEPCHPVDLGWDAANQTPLSFPDMLVTNLSPHPVSILLF